MADTAVENYNDYAPDMGPANDASRVSAEIRQGKQKGRALRTAGFGTQAGGVAMQAGGKVAKGIGKGVQNIGTRLSATGPGAFLGVPLAAAGAATRLGGEVIDKAGKKTRQIGRITSKAGKMRAEKPKTQGMSGKVTDKAMDTISQPARVGTNWGLRAAWGALIGSWGLSFIWINTHGFLRMIFGEKLFCKYGNEWIPKGVSAVGGEATKTVNTALRVGETLLVAFINIFILFLLFLVIILIVIIADPMILGFEFVDKYSFLLPKPVVAIISVYRLFNPN